MKDATGNYLVGLRGLVVPSLMAGAVLWGLTKSLERKAFARAALAESS